MILIKVVELIVDVDWCLDGVIDVKIDGASRLG